uniref:Uncharacterized protein n=1 Tax=Petromyzon marinus TaxID=7757 RepID=S4S0G0_PETMA
LIPHRASMTNAISRGRKATQEEHTATAVLADEENERVIRADDGAHPGAAHHHDRRGGRRGLRALLVDLHEGLVGYVRHVKVPRPVDAREVGLPLREDRGHAQALQVLVERVGLLEAEARQVQLHLQLAHVLGRGPLPQGFE